MPENITANTERTYRIDPIKVKAAIKSVEKANSRLERFGIEDRFEYDINQVFLPVKGKPNRREEFTEFTVNVPSISIAGAKFLAVVSREGEEEDERLIVKTATHTELHGWVPESLVCDECGQNRKREKTYIVEHDGRRLQLGSTCVEGYLGISPQGLWALEFELDPAITADVPTTGTIVYPVKEVLMTALAVSLVQEAFISKSRADEFDTEPTVHLVTKQVLGEFRTKEDHELHTRIVEKQMSLDEDAHMAALKDQVSQMPSDTTYARNVQTLIQGDYVSSANFALLISPVGAYFFKNFAPKVEKIEYSEQHFGEEGMKLAGIQAVVTKVVDHEDYDYYDNPITKSRITFRTVDGGHRLMWFASKQIDLEEGVKITFKSGSVKSHMPKNEKFNSVTTAITRVKTIPADQ